jgi:hypothetical protein
MEIVGMGIWMNVMVLDDDLWLVYESNGDPSSTYFATASETKPLCTAVVIKSPKKRLGVT